MSNLLRIAAMLDEATKVLREFNDNSSSALTHPVCKMIENMRLDADDVADILGTCYQKLRVLDQPEFHDCKEDLLTVIGYLRDAITLYERRVYHQERNFKELERKEKAGD